MKTQLKFAPQEDKIASKTLTWETLGVETVSLPPLKNARKVTDIQARVDLVVPSVSEGQFIRIWSTEVQSDPRKESLNFLESIFDNCLVAEMILAFTPGKRVEFPFQGNWGNGVGQLNPACSGELYVGHGEGSKVATFLLGRVMDGDLYFREYHFSSSKFFEARQGVAKVKKRGYAADLEIFSWHIIKGKATEKIENKICKLQVTYEVDNFFHRSYSWNSDDTVPEYEIEFMKDSPVEFVLAKQVPHTYMNSYFGWSEVASDLWRPVKGPHAKSFYPQAGDIFPVVPLGQGYRGQLRRAQDFRKRIPIRVREDVYIINSEHVKKHETGFYNYVEDAGLGNCYRAQLKASYNKEAFIQSSFLTKKMRTIFNRCKILSKTDSLQINAMLQTRSERILSKLKLLALESGSKVVFVEKLTNMCKMTEEKAEEIYERVKIKGPKGAVQTMKDTSCPPPASFSSLCPNDASSRRRKRKPRKKKYSKAYQDRKDRNYERRIREKKLTLARKEARDAKTARNYDFDPEYVCGCCRCCGSGYVGWDDEWDEEPEDLWTGIEEDTTVKKMYEWFYGESKTLPRKDTKAKEPKDEARESVQSDPKITRPKNYWEDLSAEVQPRKLKRKEPKSWPTPEKKEASRKRRTKEKLRTKQRKAARNYKESVRIRT